jgi:hypothetical protein
MSHEEKTQEMVQNYIQNRDQSGATDIMEFHRTHLWLFLNRFHQFLARFGTPSSALLSHEIFLVVEAATIVAKSDWAKCSESEKERFASFSTYFDAFNELTSGLEPLDRTTASCLEALTFTKNI